MTIIKANMNVKSDEGYVTVFPTTSSDQVKMSDGSDLEAKLSRIDGYLQIESSSYTSTASTNGQSEFAFQHPGFSLDNNSTIIVVDGKTLVYGVDYTITIVDGNPKVVLLDPSAIKAGDNVQIIVESKPNIPSSGGGGIGEVEKYTITATTEGQTVFPFNSPNFDKNVDRTMVFYQNEVLVEGTEYTVGDGPTIILTNGARAGYLIHIIVFKVSTSTGGSTAGASMTMPKLSKYTIEATTPGQTQFDFQDANFSKDNSDTLVFLQNEILVEDYEYTVADDAPVITLTEGVDPGYKLHVITASGGVAGVDGGPVSLDNIVGINAHNKDLLKRAVSPSAFYVDPVNGDDSNDGSSTKPFKTLSKVGGVVSNKNSSYFGDLTVYLSDGEHIGTLKVERAKGYSVTVIGSGPNTVLRGSSIDCPLQLVFSEYVRVTNLTIIPQIMDISSTTGFRARSVGVYARSVDSLIIEETVIMNGSEVINHSDFDVYTVGLTSVELDQCNSVRLSHESHNFSELIRVFETTRVSLDNKSITHQKDSKQSIYSFNSVFVLGGGVKPYVEILHNTGLEMSQVNNGIIVESGSNTNGSYVKYGNGIIHITHQIIVPVDSSNDSVNVGWVLPHTITDYNYQTSIQTIRRNLGPVVYAGNADKSITFTINTIDGSAINSTSDLIALDILCVGRWK